MSHAAKSDTSLFQGKRVVIIEQAGLPFHGRQCISRCMRDGSKGTETGVAIPERSVSHTCSSQRIDFHQSPFRFLRNRVPNLILWSETELPNVRALWKSSLSPPVLSHSTHHLSAVKTQSNVSEVVLKANSKASFKSS